MIEEPEPDKINDTAEPANTTELRDPPDTSWLEFEGAHRKSRHLLRSARG